MRVVQNRNPNIAGGDGKLEALREHADDCEHFSIQGDRLAENARIATQIIFPEAVGDDGYASGAGRVVSRLERAAKRRLNVDDVKKIRGNESAANARGLFTSGEINALRRVSGDALERAILLPDIFKIRIRSTPARRAVSVFYEEDH